MIKFLEQWGMLAVTAVYVVATILICVSNWASSRSAKKQLEEMKREHEETKRLSAMPFLLVENTYVSSNQLGHELHLDVKNEKEADVCSPQLETLYVKNIGNGTATNIYYKWEVVPNEYHQEEFPVIAIMRGDGYGISAYFGFYSLENYAGVRHLELIYNDIMGNFYSEKLYFYFEKGRLDQIDYYPPVYLSDKNSFSTAESTGDMTHEVFIGKEEHE